MDTIACLSSLFNLRDTPFRIVVCDNCSPDNSYYTIREWLINQQQGYMAQHNLIELDHLQAEKYRIAEKEQGLYLVQTGENRGYSAGNNVGIRFALNQPDMCYVWILNNDTEVEPDSLYYMVQRCELDSRIGICGSRLIYYYDRNRLQGLGGIFNSWFCTSYHYAENLSSYRKFNDDDVANNIDYVIGASMLLKRQLLEEIGLLCEDYFLYYEEIDLALRAKNKFNLAVASDAVVFHKEGGSTSGGKSDLADFCYIKNKLLIAKKFYPQKYIIVWLSLFYSILNRIRRGEWRKVANVFKIIFSKL